VQRLQEERQSSWWCCALSSALTDWTAPIQAQRSLLPPAMLFAAPEPELFPPARKLSADARKLREVYARYACFAQAIPTFRSREFAKVVKEAGLMTSTFNSACTCPRIRSSRRAPACCSRLRRIARTHTHTKLLTSSLFSFPCVCVCVPVPVLLRPHCCSR
jgi:hypothetical protein